MAATHAQVVRAPVAGRVTALQAAIGLRADPARPLLTLVPEDSGLRVVIDMIRTRDLPVPVIEFTRDDIVRSGLCAMWVMAFDGVEMQG